MALGEKGTGREFQVERALGGRGTDREALVQKTKKVLETVLITFCTRHMRLL